MNPTFSFQRFAGLSAVVAFPIGLASQLILLMLAWSSMSAFTDPTVLLPLGPRGANLVRWAFILDLVGSYLLLAPLALFLWRRFEDRSPEWIRFFTFSGLGYITIGVVGATILAAAVPPLLSAYSQRPAAGQPIMATLLSIPVEMVYVGMWNVLEMLLAATWIGGVGLLLLDEQRVLARFSLVLAGAALVNAAGAVFGLPALGRPGLFLFMILAPCWGLWLGLGLLRMPTLKHQIHLEAAV